MSSLKHSPLPTLTSLSSSFTDLESVLEPLLAHKYDSLNAALQANSSSPATQPSASTSANDEGTTDELRGRLDAARMQVSVAYVLMDLVWILLKTKGVDTTSHPVMQELERVKSYFKKIQSAQAKDSEDGQDQSKVDKSAAGRFIRAALSGAAAETQGKHTKFEDESSTATVAQPKAKKSKKVAAEASPEKTSKSKSPSKTDVSTPGKSKKKRPAMDPFEGYDKPATPKQSQTDPATPSPSKKKKHKKGEQNLD